MIKYLLMCVLAFLDIRRSQGSQLEKKKLTGCGRNEWKVCV